MRVEPSPPPIAVTERRTVGPLASPLAAPVAEAAAVPVPAAAAVPATTQRSDYLVLSAAAYTALSHAPSLDPEVAATFSLTLLSANGELAVTPGAIPGTVHVSLELEQVRGWPPVPGPLTRLALRGGPAEQLGFEGCRFQARRPGAERGAGDCGAGAGAGAIDRAGRIRAGG